MPNSWLGGSVEATTLFNKSAFKSCIF